MTPKTQTNARLSPSTRSKLDALVVVYGTQAEALAVAVDRLHEATFPPQAEALGNGNVSAGVRLALEQAA